MTEVTEISITNQALGWLGADPITSFDDDQTEAKLAKVNYAPLRDAVLEDHAWTFAAARVKLTPSAISPAFGSDNRFLLPADNIRVIRVEDTENNFGSLEWTLEENHIIAVVEKVFVYYTKRIEDPAKFSIAFSQALAQRLASDMAIPLTESAKLSELHWGLYVSKIDAAAATDGMQGRAQRTRATRLLKARRGQFPDTIGGFAIGDPLV